MGICIIMQMHIGSNGLNERQSKKRVWKKLYLERKNGKKVLKANEIRSNVKFQNHLRNKS